MTGTGTEPLPGGARGVDALALRHGTFVRAVRFVVPGWWRKDHGPLLAFTREGQRPVALAATGSGYHIVDPARRESGPLDAAAAARLDPKAFRLYPRAGTHAGLERPWSLFLEGVRRSRRDLIRAGAVSLALAALSAALPLAALTMFQHIVPGGDDGPLPRLALVLALLIGAAGLFEAGRAVALLRFEGGVETSVMAALLRRIVRMEVAFVRRRTPEELARGLLGVPRLLSRLRGVPLHQAMNWGMIPAGLAVLGWLDSRLLPVGLLLVAPAVLTPAISSVASHALECRYFRERVTGRRFLFEMLRGIAGLRLLDAESRAARNWDMGYTREKGLERRIRRSETFRTAFADSYPWLTLGGMILIAGRWGPVAFGTLPAIVLAWWQCVASASALGAAASSLIRALPFLDHISLITAAPLEPEGESPRGHAGEIEVRRVSYHYEGTGMPVLRDIDMRVGPGELIAIAGPSGSGKSTLLRLLLGFDQPRAGEILVGGIRLPDLDRPAWRLRVGAVLQGDRIGSAQTLRGHICGLAPYGLEDAWRATEAALLAPDIQRMPMGMQSIVEEGKLSTGQQQRLLIARQLVRRPELLILDEATNAIPEEMQAQLIANLRRLGLTCVMVTHRESALALADRVYVLEEGRITFSGRPEEFLGRMRLRRLLAAEVVEVE